MNTILEFRKYFLVENAPNFFTKQDIEIVNILLTAKNDVDVLKVFIENLYNISSKTWWYLLGIIYVN